MSAVPLRIVVYTAITGGYESLRDPRVVDPSITYRCFTDTPRWHSLINGRIWQIAGLPRSTLDPARRSREPKLLPHRFFADGEFDVSVWIDGNVDVIGDVRRLVEQHAAHPMVGFRHPDRDCIYDEAAECIRRRLDDPGVLERVVARYRAEGYPRRRGLTEANVMIRRHHDPSVVRLMEAWWHELVHHSRRDQMSLMYCAWRLGFTIATMGHVNARGSSDVFRVARGWRTTPRQSRLKILYDKYLRWRLAGQR